MARPIHADADATRRQVLLTARRLFSDLGPERTTMRHIAQQAGVSMATIHHYFGSKAQLYESCNEAYVGELLALRQRVEQTLVGARNLQDAVERSVRTAWQFAREQRSMVRLMVRNVLDTGETHPEERERTLRPVLDQGAALLAPLLDAPPVQVRLTIMAVIYLITRFVLNAPAELALLVGSPASDEAVVDQVVEDYLVAATFRLLGLPPRA